MKSTICNRFYQFRQSSHRMPAPRTANYCFKRKERFIHSFCPLQCVDTLLKPSCNQKNRFKLSLAPKAKSIIHLVASAPPTLQFWLRRVPPHSRCFRIQAPPGTQQPRWGPAAIAGCAPGAWSNAAPRKGKCSLWLGAPKWLSPRVPAGLFCGCRCKLP